jgi:hypothetical protein
MVVVETRQGETVASVQAGAIRDARLRQARRRKRSVVVVVALAGLGLLTAWLANVGSNSHSTGRTHASMIALERAKRLTKPDAWRISPALDGGSYGWCIHEEGGGSCASVPAVTTAGPHNKMRVSIGTLAGNSGNGREERITALLSSSVHAVLARGRPVTVLTRAALPYHLHLAQILLALPKYGSPRPPLLAIGAHGEPLGYLHEQAAGMISKIHWWKKPASGAPGPCQIHAHGLPGLEPQWGHVAATIQPYPTKIIGRAFFSCADTEYYLHKWPLDTAILLDAQNPGNPPAAIPGMTPVARAPGLFDASGGFHGAITAIRHGNAWLVVAGGSGLSQRIDVLRHLTATITDRHLSDLGRRS